MFVKEDLKGSGNRGGTGWNTGGGNNLGGGSVPPEEVLLEVEFGDFGVGVPSKLLGNCGSEFSAVLGRVYEAILVGFKGEILENVAIA